MQDQKIDQGKYKGISVTVWQTGPTDKLCYDRQFYAKTSHIDAYEGSYSTALHDTHANAVFEVLQTIDDSL